MSEKLEDGWSWAKIMISATSMMGFVMFELGTRRRTRFRRCWCRRFLVGEIMFHGFDMLNGMSTRLQNAVIYCGAPSPHPVVEISRRFLVEVMMNFVWLIGYKYGIIFC